MPPVRHREIIIRKRLITARFQCSGCFFKVLRPEFLGHIYHFAACSFFVLLSMNRFEHQGNLFGLAARNRMQHVTIKMHNATLPLGIGVKLSKRLQKTKAFVRHYQVDTLKATPSQISEKLSPAFRVFA